MDDFRVELQALLRKFTDANDVSDGECHTLALTIVNVVTSDLDIRQKFYKTMQAFAKERAKECRQQFDMILAGLDMTDEEKEKLLERIKRIVDGKDKIEN